MTTRFIFNILAVCGTAIFTGALLNIGLTFGPYWKSLSSAEFLDWYARNLKFFTLTISLCLGTTLVGLLGSLWLGWSSIQHRALWGAALACIATLLTVTAIINVPLNSQFASKAVALDQVPAALNTWLTAHAVRVALALTASVLGVVAVSR